jgi:hypothetical protein
LKDWRKVEERKTKRGKKDDLSILNWKLCRRLNLHRYQISSKRVDDSRGHTLSLRNLISSIVYHGITR